jgi:carboxyl-terminal processing protease
MLFPYKLNTTRDQHKVGYIRLKQFNANAAKEMREAAKALEAQDVDGYVLDLRGNPWRIIRSKY